MILMASTGVAIGADYGGRSQQDVGRHAQIYQVGLTARTDVFEYDAIQRTAMPPGHTGTVARPVTDLL
jgi:hypothetical protein